MSNEKRSELLGKYLLCPRGVVALWYHGRIEIDTGEDMKRVEAWAVNAEDMFPNEINVFSRMKDEYITGIGTNEEESIQNALERFVERVDKGDFDFIQLGNKLSVYSPNSVHTTVCVTLCRINKQVEEHRRQPKTTSIFLRY